MQRACRSVRFTLLFDVVREVSIGVRNDIPCDLSVFISLTTTMTTSRPYIREPPFSCVLPSISTLFWFICASRVFECLAETLDKRSGRLDRSEGTWSLKMWYSPLIFDSGTKKNETGEGKGLSQNMVR